MQIKWIKKKEKIVFSKKMFQIESNPNNHLIENNKTDCLLIENNKNS